MLKFLPEDEITPSHGIYRKPERKPKGYQFTVVALNENTYLFVGGQKSGKTFFAKQIKNAVVFDIISGDSIELCAIEKAINERYKDRSLIIYTTNTIEVYKKIRKYYDETKVGESNEL